MTSFIKSALRSASQRWPPRYHALNDAFVGKQINVKSGRAANHYKCASCKDVFPAKDVRVDHIDPVVNPVKGFETWDVFIDRLFCEQEGFQILCVPCHLIKTNAEKQTKKDNK